MPRNRDFDDFDDEDDEDDNRPVDDSTLIRRLRKEIKTRDKQLSDFDNRLKEYEKRDRQEVVGSALKAAEVSDKYARWVVRDLEDSEISAETVGKWIADNAELIGFKAPEPQSTVDDETQNSLKRMQSAERGGSGTEADPIAAKLNDPNLTAADLEAIIGKSLTA